jgi:hypothetical protein
MTSAFPFTPAPADVDRYMRLRALGLDLNHRMVKTIPAEVMTKAGDALGILRKGVLVFDTKDVTGVLMDSCLYDWPLEGKSVVQRYAETHPFPPGCDEHDFLSSALGAEYRLLAPEAIRRGEGIDFRDAISGERFFVMDMGLGQSRAIDPEVLFATRVLPLGGFWMTGGAGLPLGPSARRTLFRNLEAVGVLAGSTITDRRRLARMAARACLQSGAAARVRYQDPGGVGPCQESAGYQQARRRFEAPGRNDPCPCGSGRKYKKCCQPG